jgi:hypothetical protein
LTQGKLTILAIFTGKLDLCRYISLKKARYASLPLTSSILWLLLHPDYAEIDKDQTDVMKQVAGGIKEYVSSKMKALPFTNRGLQADHCTQAVLIPIVIPFNNICGDFNDVPTSYTYFHIRGHLAARIALPGKGPGVGKPYKFV